MFQGFYKLDTGRVTSETVSHNRVCSPGHRKGSWDNLKLHELDLNAVFVQARITSEDPEVNVVPPKGFECSERQKHQIRTLKTWLYGPRSSPRDWWGTIHVHSLSQDFSRVQPIRVLQSSFAKHCQSSPPRHHVLSFIYKAPLGLQLPIYGGVQQANRIVNIEIFSNITTVWPGCKGKGNTMEKQLNRTKH